ncbi:PTB domain-containing engulfment adapter protein 1-like isoform X2 [Babylonia areolata]|uniref:PTB domain-containing engulfment adapter protein 1-like isoform X2 n=1 Tax=Babylonia areolata TaxID=304850 RepID=UPI003FD350A5
MDTVKVARDYFLSSQSCLLLPNRDYGSRKLIQVTGLPRSPLQHLPSSLLRSQHSTPASTSSSGRARFLPTRHSDSSLPVFRATSGGAAGDGGSYSSSSSSSPSGGHSMKPSTKTWLHPPEALLRGELAYNVKFLGECAVDQPKGTETVKDAIRKRKFNKQLKRAEGEKPPKVQLIISADGLRIEHPKTRAIIHEYPLHRISYCADDKSDKKMFTFIAKAATTNDHYCYVFNCSDKTAEEITLTVGQAFDLAYRRFLEEGNSGGATDRDYKKQCLMLMRRVNCLQFENDSLRKRVSELEKLKDRGDLEEYMKNNQISSLTTVMLNLRDSSEADETDETSDDFEPSAQPDQQSQVGRHLQNLVLEDDVSKSNGTAAPASAQFSAPALSPPPAPSRQLRGGQSIRQQSLPANPFTASDASSDPFGMGEFNPAPANGAAAPPVNGAPVPTSSNNIFGPSSQQELLDIQAGFSRGLSFGTDDFSLDDLDPLSQGKQ